MSLVNDMLRDLESQDGGARAGGDSAQLLAQSSFARRRRPRAFIPATVAFIVLGSATGWWLGHLAAENPSPSEQPSSTATLAAESTNSRPAPVAGPEAKEPLAAQVGPQVSQPLGAKGGMVVSVHPSTSALTANPPPVLDSGLQREIARLLDSGFQALSRDRLTSPREDNAYDRFLKVLAMAPDNNRAREGLVRITQRYLELAEVSAQEGRLEQARGLLRRAGAVQPGYPGIQSLADQLEHIQQNPASLSHETTVASAPTAVEPLSGSLSGEPQKSVARPPQESLARLTQETLTRAPSAQWLDADIARKARTLAGQGKIAMALENLNAYLAENPRAPQSTQALFHLWLQQGETSSAKALLQRSTFLPKLTRTKLKAHLLLAENNSEGALGVLESQPRSYHQDIGYLALLGGVYQQLGRYQEAADSYRRLLRMDAESPSYWLGLAVALDALRQPANALKAYRRAQEGKQSTAVKQYISARIAALSS